MTDFNKLPGINLAQVGIKPLNPPKLNLNLPKNAAEWTYERIVTYLERFQKELDEEHEIAGYLANFPNGIVHFTDIGFWGPDIITFDGLTSDGSKIKLIQNIAQLNVTLIAAKKLSEKPIRIGFDLPVQEKTK
jgi:hypothetical protein